MQLVQKGSSEGFSEHEVLIIVIRIWNSVELSVFRSILYDVRRKLIMECIEALLNINEEIELEIITETVNRNDDSSKYQ